MKRLMLVLAALALLGFSTSVASADVGANVPNDGAMLSTAVLHADNDAQLQPVWGCGRGCGGGWGWGWGGWYGTGSWPYSAYYSGGYPYYSGYWSYPYYSYSYYPSWGFGGCCY